ncbi:MAG: AAA family ATPase, partial [Deltaproteobacteria bacterium]|nr:AAA family ATPase [Deltaproteobacteria bacterium]
MAERPILRIGTQNFETVRNLNAVYVDKTGYLPELYKIGDVIFCARPRRFGKSLTVSALDAFYSGRQDLFQGLAAEKYLKAKNFIPRPVIRLDMSAAAGSETKEILKENIRFLLEMTAERHNVSLRDGDLQTTFLDLMRKVSQGGRNKAVVLVDEYDSPVIEALKNPDLLKDTREVLRTFYTQIKTGGDYLYFTFITGVCKFSRMGVFSTLNNLTDISLEHKFGAFMGLTQEELEANFQPFIRQRAKDFG